MVGLFLLLVINPGLTFGDAWAASADGEMAPAGMQDDAVSHDKRRPAPEVAAGCRMLQVAVKFLSGSNLGSQVTSGSAPRRLGNARETMDYSVRVCENTTGLINFDRQVPYVKHMYVRGGRHPAYGREVDFVQLQRGVYVHPVREGELVRLTLSPWLDSASNDHAQGTTAPPTIERVKLSSTVLVAPGQWVQMGRIAKQNVTSGQHSSRRTLGNAEQSREVWVRVDELADFE